MRPASETPDMNFLPEPKPGNLPIYGLTPFTLLDYPDKTACTVWFSGCNMRCPYCHNPEIVKGRGRVHLSTILSFLEKRRGLLDGVVLSGGEASVYPGVPDFMKTIKKMGFSIKLDTNGLRPDLIKNFLDAQLVDYIALDYKSPPEKFKRVTGTNKYELFSKTLDLLCAQNKISFETRTTVHTDLIGEDDVSMIIQDLESRGYRGLHAIQNFIPCGEQPTLKNIGPQVRKLEHERIYRPDTFEILFRNF